MIGSALLCLLRFTQSNNLEVLLTKRAYWNEEKNRPMRYPGEWMFAGGVFDKDLDENFKQTAMREFREETDFKGEFENLYFLRSCDVHSKGRIYHSEFYTCTLENLQDNLISNSSEIVDLAWMEINYILQYMVSDEFTNSQLKVFKGNDYGNSKYGKYAVKQREFPQENYNTLKLLKERRDSNQLIFDL
ncbi:MAG: NUDIX hydrolase [Nanoarchaeota archaeon]|nr:NUDIX hydrolase [Nanoarchaeota archaeon]